MFSCHYETIVDAVCPDKPGEWLGHLGSDMPTLSSPCFVTQTYIITCYYYILKIVHTHLIHPFYSSTNYIYRSQSLDDVNLQGLSPGHGLAAASENLEKSSPKTPNNLDTVRSRMMSLISSVVPGSKEKEVDSVATGGFIDSGEVEKENTLLGSKSIPLLLQVPSSSSQTVPSSLDHVFGMPIPYYHTNTRTMELSISDVPLYGK